MPSSRTPWKKSRTLGDIYGGRVRRRMTATTVAACAVRWSNASNPGVFQPD